MLRLSRRLAWYRDRLAAMEPGEVRHRLGEQWRRHHDRVRPPLPQVPAAVSVPRLPLPLPRQAAPAWQQLNRSVAAGQWHWWGVDWPSATPPDWHLDPITGRRWQADAYCFDVPFRHLDGFGDIKYLWELNRLQSLPALAALGACGEAAAGALAKRLVLDWIAHNPPWRGVNWTSGIELALRAVSLVLTTTWLPQDLWTQAEQHTVVSALAAHGAWLQRYPSLFSSANNHRTAEALGLWTIGCACPDLPDAAAWRQEGGAALQAMAASQILPDGIGGEQSPTYTAFTLECLAFASRIGDLAGTPLPLKDALRRGGLALRWMVDTKGEVPAIGDDDESRVISEAPGREAQVARTLTLLAAETGDPALLPPQPVSAPLSALIWPPLTSAPEVLEGERCFADGGYSVARRSLAGRIAVLVADHGPLGFLSIAAHGHADATAVWMSLDDQPVFIDAGTYAYHAEPGSRDRFRATDVHNCLCIGGQSSSDPAGDFNWRRKARSWREAGEIWSLRHDGYQEPFGALTGRMIAPTPTGWRIT
ncbi:MAG: alginate lyase family protein, partial [Alphaproteobacteria bacterium]|nr:alginate lyase family protein [Alphaproteobacteria bacterium]